MNKKQDMVEKDSFRQAGEDLLRKVREEERADFRLAEVGGTFECSP